MGFGQVVEPSINFSAGLVLLGFLHKPQHLPCVFERKRPLLCIFRTSFQHLLDKFEKFRIGLSKVERVDKIFSISLAEIIPHALKVNRHPIVNSQMLIHPPLVFADQYWALHANDGAFEGIIKYYIIQRCSFQSCFSKLLENLPVIYAQALLQPHGPPQDHIARFNIFADSQPLAFWKVCGIILF